MKDAVYKSGVAPAIITSVALSKLSASRTRRALDRLERSLETDHCAANQVKDMHDYFFNLNANTALGIRWATVDPHHLKSGLACAVRLMGAKLFYEGGKCVECFEHCRDNVNLVCIRFQIAGEIYSWHHPGEKVPFAYVTTEASSPCLLLDSDEKLVLLAIAKFEAKAAEVTTKAA